MCGPGTHVGQNPISCTTVTGAPAGACCFDCDANGPLDQPYQSWCSSGSDGGLIALLGIGALAVAGTVVVAKKGGFSPKRKR
jgi:hypothetical protein